MTQYPPLQVFNEAGEPVGEAMLDEILQKGLLHRVIHVLVEDERGKVLLQLRGPNVRTDPNSWDFAVGGYVDAGENYLHAATRELKEELGIGGFELVDLGVQREAERVSDYDINRFAGTFKAIIPSNTILTLEEAEVAKVKWYDRDSLKRLIESEDVPMSPYVRQKLKRYYFNDENNEH